MKKPFCERCKKEVLVTTVSFMNTDIICMKCKKEERSHPMYEIAYDAERDAVAKGDLNYPGLFAGYEYPFTDAPIMQIAEEDKKKDRSILKKGRG